MKLVLDAPGLHSIGQAYTELKEMHERLARTARRRRLRDVSFHDEIQRALAEIKASALGILGRKVNDYDRPKMKLLQTLKHAFEQLDTDGSNTLSFEEFVQAWRFLGEEGTIEEMRIAFQQVDFDGSGQIDWYEFAEAILGTDSAHQSIQSNLSDLQLLIDDFKSFRRDNRRERLRNTQEKSWESELSREKQKLRQIEDTKSNLLKRIQQLRQDLEYAPEGPEAISINRELVAELGKLKTILDEERKQRAQIRVLESNFKENTSSS